MRSDFFQNHTWWPGSILIFRLWSFIQSSVKRSRLIPTSGTIVGFNELIDWNTKSGDGEGDVEDRYHYIPVVKYKIGDQVYTEMPEYGDLDRKFDIKKSVPLLFDPQFPEKVYLDAKIISSRPVLTSSGQSDKVTPMLMGYLIENDIKIITLDYTRKEIQGYNKALIDVFVTITREGKDSNFFKLTKDHRYILANLISELNNLVKDKSINFINKLEQDGYNYLEGRLVRPINSDTLQEFSTSPWKAIAQHYFRTGSK